MDLLKSDKIASRTPDERLHQAGVFFRPGAACTAYDGRPESARRSVRTSKKTAERTCPSRCTTTRLCASVLKCPCYKFTGRASPAPPEAALRTAPGRGWRPAKKPSVPRSARGRTCDDAGRRHRPTGRYRGHSMPAVRHALKSTAR
jgi:hypothetical protein